MNAPWAASGQKRILVLGRAYLPEVNPEYSGIKLRASEVDQAFCGSLAGLPVYIEHDNSARVGTVLHAYLSPRMRHLMVFLLLEDEWCNTFLPLKLSFGPDGRRAFNDLSFCHVVNFSRSGGVTRVETKVPEEVSIVGRGDNPGTFIFDWWFVDEPVEELVKHTIPRHVQRFDWVDFVDEHGYDHARGGYYCRP